MFLLKYLKGMAAKAQYRLTLSNQETTYEYVDVSWWEQIEGAVLYPGSRPTVLKIRLRYVGLVLLISLRLCN